MYIYNIYNNIFLYLLLKDREKILGIRYLESISGLLASLVGIIGICQYKEIKKHEKKLKISYSSSINENLEDALSDPKEGSLGSGFTFLKNSGLRAKT